MYNTQKMNRIAWYFILFLCSQTAFAQKGHFKSEIDFGSGTEFSTFFDVSSNKGQFTITSPKNADVRIFGGKAKLGRMMGKSPKKGIIITISGKQQGDSLLGDTNMPMVGKLKFKGTVNGQTLSGQLLNTDGLAIGEIRGVASTADKMDYAPLYPKMLQIVQEHIYDPKVLLSPEWKNFEVNLKAWFQKAHDDIELYFGFNMMAPKLPFSHLSLALMQEVPEDDEEGTVTAKSVVFEEKDTHTAYLKIKDFSRSTAELGTILPVIVANSSYKNLIIDLRGNGGGGVEAAFKFAQYITENDMEVGYFPTNKLQYSGYQPELFKTLPEMQPEGTSELTTMLKTTKGVKLLFKKPGNPVFKGAIYILTDSKTASTCEPIVYALKNSKRATIVGEKTAGAMLSACAFPMSGKYNIVLPVADFYTYDGVRLDRVGVQPDVAVAPEAALDKALELIRGKE